MFQVGDRVRVNDEMFVTYGQVGKVVALYNDGRYPLDVLVDGTTHPAAFRADEVKKISE